MKALMLAAGKGERLRPITDTIPKVMVEIDDKPCLQHNIELLKKYKITDIAINTHYFPEQIKEYFKDGKNFGVNITYSYEPEILGTAGSLNNFKDYFDDNFFVICGDLIHKTNLQEMLNFHKQKKGIVTITLAEGNQFGKGVVITDKNYRILKFVEKPQQEIPNGLINTGVYLMSKKVFDYLPKGFSDLGHNIFPDLLKNKEKMYGFKSPPTIDIGTKQDLEKARALFI